MHELKYISKTITIFICIIIIYQLLDKNKKKLGDLMKMWWIIKAICSTCIGALNCCIQNIIFQPPHLDLLEDSY